MPGADKACGITADSGTPGTVNGTRVVARAGRVVVDVSYVKVGELAESSEETAVTR